MSSVGHIERRAGEGTVRRYRADLHVTDLHAVGCEHMDSTTGPGSDVQVAVVGHRKPVGYLARRNYGKFAHVVAGRAALDTAVVGLGPHDGAISLCHYPVRV